MEDTGGEFHLSEEDQDEIRKLMKETPVVSKLLMQIHVLKKTMKNLSEETKELRNKMEAEAAVQERSKSKKRRAEQPAEVCEAQISIETDGKPDMELQEFLEVLSSVPTTSSHSSANVKKPSAERISSGSNAKQTERRSVATKNTRQPPVVILENMSELRDLITKIKTTLGENAYFSTRYTRSNTKIYTFSDTDREKVQTMLTAQGIGYHTYTARQHKTKSLIAKLGPNLDVDEMIDELKEKILDVITCKQLTTKKRGPEVSCSYLVRVPRDVNLGEVRKVKDLAHTKVRWERFVRTNDVLQCFKCQRFGHGQASCGHPERCIKCPESHRSFDCGKKKEEKPYCVNCEGEHPANYSECPARVAIKQEIKSRQEETARKRIEMTKKTVQGISYSQMTKGKDARIAERDEGRTETSAGKSNNTEDLLQQIKESLKLPQLIAKLKTLKEKLTHGSLDEKIEAAEDLMAL